MILLTNLSGDLILINPDLIETIESIPDTKLVMASGKRWTVRETVEEVMEKFSDSTRNFSESVPIRDRKRETLAVEL